MEQLISPSGKVAPIYAMRQDLGWVETVVDGESEEMGSYPVVAKDRLHDLSESPNFLCPVFLLHSLSLSKNGLHF